MAANIIRDGFGELLETGKAVKKQAGQIAPGKIARTAVSQLTGTGKQPPAPKLPVTREKTALDSRSNGKGPGDLTPQAMSEEEMKAMQQKDAARKEQGISSARAQLEQIKIQRYQTTQQEILAEQRKKEQGQLPAYEAGKPGAARTVQERLKMEARKRKEEEEKKMSVQLPKSERKLPGLGGIFGRIREKRGTKEVGKKTIG